MLLLTANTCEANLPVELNTTKLPKQYSGIPTARATTNTRQHLWHSMGQSAPPSDSVTHCRRSGGEGFDEARL